MMLGAVLPEMRSQVEVLAADLAELIRLRKQIAEERDQFARDLLVLADDRQRLSLLVEERQKKQAEAEKALAEERQRTAQLARQANDLRELIAKLQQDLDAPGRPPARRCVRATTKRRLTADRSCRAERIPDALFRRSPSYPPRECCRCLPMA